MSVIADVERLLERVFERTSARVFRTRLQAVQLERRVERAMELARTVEDGRPIVPEAIRVRLSPTDLRSAAGAGGAELLATRLAESALAFARRNRFHLEARPTVSLVADASLPPGQVDVEVARAGRRGPGAPRDVGVSDGARPAERPLEGGPSAHTSGSQADEPEAGPPDDLAASLPASDAPVGPWVEAGGSVRDGHADPTRTMVYRRPAPEAPRARLREIRRDGTERSIELAGGLATVGRARDNAIVIDDGRVSRQHGRLQARRGALVYTDLGSTNGSRVNGVRVDEIALGYGDRLEVGDTVLVVETLPG
jgi:hypothetical protein